MLTFNEYLAIANRLAAQLNLPEKPAGLYDPIRYVMTDGGKRLRPVLTLAAADAFGAGADNVANQAAGIELFHNFTLLHDDVMDKSAMRRGRPTVHCKWNESTAILSGDTMLTLAGMKISATEKPAVGQALMAMFNRTAIEVYEGQQYDMDFEQRSDVSVDEYLEMIRLKTSVLLGCAAALGAIASEASESRIRAIYRYGEQLGLAFQLRDDLLDTFGDPATFGKKIGGDIANNKKTWLLITAMSEDKSGVIAEELENPSPEKFARVRGVYEQLNLPQRCQSLINDYESQAIDALAETELQPAEREFFVNLAALMTNRAK